MASELALRGAIIGRELQLIAVAYGDENAEEELAALRAGQPVNRLALLESQDGGMRYGDTSHCPRAPSALVLAADFSPVLEGKPVIATPYSREDHNRLSLLADDGSVYLSVVGEDYGASIEALESQSEDRVTIVPHPPIHPR